MLCLEDYEEYAKNHLSGETWDYYSQGAEREVTLRENLLSFTRYNLIPSMLLNTPQRDLSSTVLGQKISLPVGIAPTAQQKLAHSNGEIASSKAAEDIGTVFTLSSLANTSLEDVAESLSKRKSPLWMHLAFSENRCHNEEFIRRAESSGYDALVLTVDCPIPGLKLKTMKRGGLKLLPQLTVPNFEKALKEVKNSIASNNLSDIGKYSLKFDLSWKDVAWIKTISKLPLILKGILTAKDALKAVQYGADAVWVSTHGGRQLDGVNNALDVLPEIASALRGTGCEVYVDGGVRWGSDVLKALALGAQAVFIGRPVLWGLAHSGQQGVKNILEILRSELDRAMHLAGCKDIRDIGPHLVQKKLYCRL